MVALDVADSVSLKLYIPTIVNTDVAEEGRLTVAANSVAATSKRIHVDERCDEDL